MKHVTLFEFTRRVQLPWLQDGSLTLPRVKVTEVNLNRKCRTGFFRQTTFCREIALFFDGSRPLRHFYGDVTPRTSGEENNKVTTGSHFRPLTSGSLLVLSLHVWRLLSIYLSYINHREGNAQSNILPCSYRTEKNGS